MAELTVVCGRAAACTPAQVGDNRTHGYWVIAAVKGLNGQDACSPCVECPLHLYLGFLWILFE